MASAVKAFLVPNLMEGPGLEHRRKFYDEKESENPNFFLIDIQNISE